MVKHTQKIRRQQPTNCLSVFDHFLELALKWLSTTEVCIYIADKGMHLVQKTT